MSQLFIDQVRAIVLDNLSNDKFGAKELASKLGLSTSQTLRKVKAASNKSVNQYIRELRLENAAKLIKKTDDTIAEISYKVGFGSPSYFNKAFVKYYGIAPGEYKTKSLKLSDLKPNEVTYKTRPLLSKKNIFYSIALMLMAVVMFFVITNSLSNKSPLQNSIAVLPFKDLSPVDTQWFCDGVSENILHSLAQIKGLSVTSFTSSSTFRDSDKQIPQIAKELGVSYILEGSVVMHDGKIKILTQLIDANDQHVWSKEYNDDFENIIDVQNNVAQEIMKQLEITLSPEESKTLKHYPTENMEAYNLHMEGRLINESMRWEDLQKNIEYNKSAVLLDSNFVDAYTEVATSNMLLAITRDVSANHKWAKEAITYADKALEINPKSARAYAVKARMFLGNDWDKSKEYFQKAINLNPNDAETHYWYAFYSLRSDDPDIKKALQHATIAVKLSPFSGVFAERYIWTLMLNKKYDDAEDYMNDYGFLLSEQSDFILKTRLMSLKTESWATAFSWTLDRLKREPENAFLHRWASAGYEQIAQDINQSLIHAKKAYELDHKYFHNYFYLLVNNKFFKEAEIQMQTEEFLNLPSAQQFYYSWMYNYYKGNYYEALKIIKNNPDLFGYSEQSKTYAQLGDITKVDSVNKLFYFYGEHKNQWKAEVQAILKKEDSMYYYLDKTKFAFTGTVIAVCASRDLAPYRNEERFKALLKDHFIPYTPTFEDIVTPL
ncbi:TolB-like protein [Winogradskyella epiphytica]|uniref:TolB-like protein n=1 Tax=Winogradskyella epiphytica TaxID=262005 RepID=A0A2V4X6A1_9FLAO|nr:helix-turn-helix domain-containing protein [Winogradskyella epiphytica]PYE80699.1 TolB-like protein [Winogradskyella epiphytica]GGW67806.1 hypothetical protein GCM10008085_19610 [Winogradskyella epiphytica]